MRKRRFVLAFVILVARIVDLPTSALATLVEERYNHVYPGSYRRWAQESWESGRYTQSLQQLADAATEALECGVRDRLAQPDIDEMKSLGEKEQFEAALKRCVSAVNILDGCDDEGVMSYNCSVWEYRSQCDVVEGQLKCNH